MCDARASASQPTRNAFTLAAADIDKIVMRSTTVWIILGAVGVLVVVGALLFLEALFGIRLLR